MVKASSVLCELAKQSTATKLYPALFSKMTQRHKKLISKFFPSVVTRALSIKNGAGCAKLLVAPLV